MDLDPRFPFTFARCSRCAVRRTVSSASPGTAHDVEGIGHDLGAGELGATAWR